MLWSEIPVYPIKHEYLQPGSSCASSRANELRDNILVNGNHPSIIVWSIANELNPRPGPVQGFTSRDAAGAAQPLDPTRPVGAGVAGYPTVACQPRYAPLDVIGINEYFGWYPGPNGSSPTATLLSDYLDQCARCYPNKALVITETGAEANRHGPVEERGTYEFQQRLRQLPPRRLRDEAVAVGRDLLGAAGVPRAPGLGRRQPAPAPPFHQKGADHARLAARSPRASTCSGSSGHRPVRRRPLQRRAAAQALT